MKKWLFLIFLFCAPWAAAQTYDAEWARFKKELRSVYQSITGYPGEMLYFSTELFNNVWTPDPAALREKKDNIISEYTEIMDCYKNVPKEIYEDKAFWFKSRIYPNCLYGVLVRKNGESLLFMMCFEPDEDGDFEFDEDYYEICEFA